MSVSRRLETFVAFSAEVTAFTPTEVWGTGLTQRYLDTVDGVVGTAMTDALLNAFDRITTQSAGERTAKLRQTVFGCEQLGPVARAVVKLWYIGTWYALPAAWQERFGPAAQDGTFVPTPDAYVEGLLWSAIGAHPPGAKAQGFGSWQFPPGIPKF
ncbi:MAG: hypothetical protein JSS39_04295 [Nitrospira sp.]|nr:hypothetical protein [Nitrospira sp.]